MGRYDFQSTGAAAGNAIQQFLQQRAEENRQRLLQELTQQKQAADIEARNRDLELRQQTEARQASELAATREALNDERGFRRATTLADNAMPGDAVDDPTRSLLEKHGYGGQIKKIPGVVAQGPQTGTTEDDIPLYDVTQSPDAFQMRGGSKYLNAEAQRDLQERLAQDAEAGRTERAAEDREMRAVLAQIAASGRADSSDLRNKLLEVQTALAQDKLDAERTERDRADASRTNGAQNAITLLDRLDAHPGLGKATGAYEMRGFTQDAQDWKAIRDQVVAALTVPNLGSLKGPASDKDILFMKQLSTRLENPNISSTEAKQAITDARAFLQTGVIPAAGTSGGGSGDRVRVVGPNGQTGTVPRGTALPAGWSFQ